MSRGLRPWVASAALALAGCPDTPGSATGDATSTGGDTLATSSRGASDGSTSDGGQGESSSGTGLPSNRADGSVGPWAELDRLPVPRANFCALAIGESVVVIGGNYPDGAGDFVKVGQVHAAPALPDGTLGPWAEVGMTPSPVTQCTAATVDQHLFVLDGLFDDDAHAERVWRASLEVQGTLSAWEDLGPLPSGTRLISSKAWVESGALLSVWPRLVGDGDRVDWLRAPLLDGGGNDDPVPGQWESQPWIEGFRAQTQLAIRPDRAMLVGGFLGDAVTDRGFASALDTAGNVGAPVEQPGLPVPRGFGDAVVVDDFIFVLGGKDEALAGDGQPNVYSAALTDDGGWTAWAEQTPLPQGRTNFQAVFVGDYVYVLGGGFDGGGLDTVFAARVRFAG